MDPATLNFLLALASACFYMVLGFILATCIIGYMGLRFYNSLLEELRKKP